MDQKLRNLLVYAGVFALVVLSLAAAGYVRAYTRTHDPVGNRSFGVVGEGKVTLQPDVAQFSYSVISQDTVNNVVALQTKNTEKINKTLAYLESQGVDKKDVTTSGYDLGPEYSYSICTPDGTCPPPKITGYKITQKVLVKVRDLAKAGNLLSGVVQNGANDVSNLNFVIDDATKVEAEARALAIRMAHQKAEATARAGGFKLGRLMYLEDNVSQPYYDESYKLGMGGETSANYAMPTSAPRVEPGSKEVKISVMARYEIR